MKDFLKKLFGGGDSEDEDRIVRDPEFAGVQYPEELGELREAVDGHLDSAGDTDVAGEVRGVVAPYGDFRYAGPVMGAAYAAVADETSFDRVVVVGPSTRVPFRGLAVAGYEAWATPLGESDIDLAGLEHIVGFDAVRGIEAAFEPAAALELQLPFIQRRFDASLVPLLVGDTDAETVADLFDEVWDERTLLVVSATLSRGRAASEAEAVDDETLSALEALETDSIDRDRTDARTALRGLIETVRRRDGGIARLDYRTSSEAERGADQVVGFGAAAVYSSSAG